MRRLPRGLLVAIFVLSSLMLLPGAASADSTSRIDFEGIPEGASVSSVSSGFGISGDVLSGSVAVFGKHPAFAPNRAIIFDAECDGGCTGSDFDLLFPGQGNVLVIAENIVDTNADGRVDNPGDADVAGAFFTFDFSGLAGGVVTVKSLVQMDLGDDTNELMTVNGVPGMAGKVDLYAGGPAGTLLATVPIEPVGNNQKASVAINVSGVTYMVVTLGGSGAIDNIDLEIPSTGAEGCTPGFWKNKPQAWVGYATSDSFDSVFGVTNSIDANLTLIQGADLGGGGENALIRHAVAALLNAANTDVDYPLSSAQVIASVQDAYATGNFESVKNILEGHNELGCPISEGAAQPTGR